MQFRWSLVVETRTCGAGEGNFEEDLTYERDPMVRICRKRSVGGVVGPAGPLLGRTHYYGI